MPKSKLQNVNFKTVDDLLDYLPEDELKMVKLLRKLVLDCLPNAQEKLSYNVPFYKIHKTVCFIWPSSILWGKTISFKGVRFGFQNGNLLEDEINYLDKGTRKQVYWKDFARLTEINTDLLKAYIFEAALIDQERKNVKKKTAWSR